MGELCWEAAGAAGHAQPSMCTGGSPPPQRQLEDEERMWVGMESEMVHEKVSCCWLHLANIQHFCAGWASLWDCAAVGHFNR